MEMGDLELNATNVQTIHSVLGRSEKNILLSNISKDARIRIC